MARASTNLNLHRLIKEASSVNDTPPEVSFMQDLKRTVVLENPIKPFATPFYKPSSMQCMRMMYYQIVGVERDKKEKSCININMGECGTDRHKRIQYYITKMKSHGMDCEFVSVANYIKQNNLTDIEIIQDDFADADTDEEEGIGFETLIFIKSLKVRLKCDGLIKYNGKYYVLEIKTEVSYNWQMRNKVASKHVIQACCYSYAFGLDTVIFLYENRDICEWKAFSLTVSPDMKKEYVTNRIKVCDLYVVEKRVPPISGVEEKEACKYCDYKRTCKLNGHTEVMKINYEEL